MRSVGDAGVVEKVTVGSSVAGLQGMHQLKVALLFVLTVAAMRLLSWALLWLMGWAFKSVSIGPRLASNAIALSGFSAYLLVDKVPGEPLDAAALAFGGIVFCIFFAIDTRWLPRPFRNKGA